MWAVAFLGPSPLPLVPGLTFSQTTPRAVAASAAPRHGSDAVADDPKSSPPSGTPNAQQERELRGFDVLRALQRAAAVKARSSDAKKKKARKKRNDAGSHGGGEMDDTALNDNSVKPLCINSEWRTRLDELEGRLQELSETRLN